MIIRSFPSCVSHSASWTKPNPHRPITNQMTPSEADPSRKSLPRNVFDVPKRVLRSGLEGNVVGDEQPEPPWKRTWSHGKAGLCTLPSWVTSHLQLEARKPSCHLLTGRDFMISWPPQQRASDCRYRSDTTFTPRRTWGLFPWPAGPPIDRGSSQPLYPFIRGPHLRLKKKVNGRHEFFCFVFLLMQKGGKVVHGNWEFRTEDDTFTFQPSIDRTRWTVTIVLTAPQLRSIESVVHCLWPHRRTSMPGQIPF